MTAVPSDLVYQAHAARRQELLVDAAIEQRAAQVERTSSRETTVIGHARRRIGYLLIVLGNGLVDGAGATELQPALEP